MFLKRTRVFQIPRDKRSVYLRVYNWRKMRKDQKVRFLKLVCVWGGWIENFRELVERSLDC